MDIRLDTASGISRFAGQRYRLLLDFRVCRRKPVRAAGLQVLARAAEYRYRCMPWRVARRKFLLAPDSEDQMQRSPPARSRSRALFPNAPRSFRFPWGPKRCLIEEQNSGWAALPDC